jgi:hypothetical protein
LIPDESNPGDEICIIRDAAVPLVIRKKPGDKGRYSIIGECYIHSMMYGEGVTRPGFFWKDVTFM